MSAIERGELTTADPTPREVDRPVKGRGASGAGWVSDMVVERLRELGCRYLPLTPGSSFRGLHDSVVNHGGNRDPQLILCVHEAIAVATAHAYAKATGSVAVVALHDLVGLMNAQMAIYNAWCDRTPLIVLGGGGPADPDARRPIDWVHSAEDQAELVRRFVTFDAQPKDVDGLLAAIVEAYTAAGSGPTGLAYLTLDVALQEQRLAGPAIAPSPLPSKANAATDPGTVARAADRLVAAHASVILAGRTGLDPRATPPLVALAETLGAAVVDERNFVSLPTSHPLNLTGDGSVLAEADVILAVDPHDLRAALDRATPDRSPALIVLGAEDPSAPSWSNFRRAQPVPDVMLRTDPVSGLTALLEAVRARLSDADQDRAALRRRASAVRERHAHLRDRQRRTLAARWDDRPVSGSRLVSEVWHAVRDRPWLLTVRNTRSWPHGVWDFDRAGRYLGHSGGGGVGYGPGAMIGGGLAARDRGELPVAIIGDGDLLMAPAALWTAVHHRLPLLVVVNDNRSFGNDEVHQEDVAQQRERPMGNARIGTRIDEPAVDVPALARSFGCWAEGPIADPGELGTALARALAQVDAGRVAVVDVLTGNP